ncbi:hypothetical protein C3L33_01793, partial [Rhododendron williamsianum]
MVVGMKSPMAIQNTQSPPFTTTPPRRSIAFTTPENYAARLSHLLRLKGWAPLWCPTVLVQTTPHTKTSLLLQLSPPKPNPNPNPNNKSSLESYSAIAFTSRTGISAFSEALEDAVEPPLLQYGDVFTISALGKDSELLNDAFIERICENRKRIRVLVPKISTPGGIGEELGFGAAGGFCARCRVDAYETRWAGRECAGEVAARALGGREGGEGGLDAVVFTSTAEVEGMLKSLGEYGLDWVRVKGKWPELVVAAHGPVTAAGAERLGVGVDVVSERFASFEGVVDALALRWNKALEFGFEFCTFRNLDEFDNEVSCLNFTIMSTFATIGLNDTLKMSPSVNALIFRRGCGSSQWRTKVNNLFVAVGVVQAWASGGGGGGGSGMGQWWRRDGEVAVFVSCIDISAL